MLFVFFFFSVGSSIICFFFFSSRRRHTRLQGDWSSDVCSSDLAWTQPIKARIDMLSTGIRTPVGVKVIGTDLVEIDKLAKQIEQVLKAVPGTSSAYAER